MSRDWKKYNRELIKREEIPIDPEIFGVSQKKTWKTSRLSQPADNPAVVFEVCLKLPYRQKKGVAKKTFENIGLKVSNFRTLHYRLSRGSLVWKAYLRLKNFLRSTSLG